MAKLKVAVCVPSYGQWQAKFGQSLCNMLNYFLTARLEGPDGEPYDKQVETICVGGSMLPEVRHKLIAEALLWEADYILSLDADQVFPPDTLDRLLVHNLPVVGCNYVRRQIPTAPTAAALSDETGWKRLTYTMPEDAQTPRLEHVSHLGMGCVLIHKSVFDALQLHAEQQGDGNFLPLFKFEETENKMGLKGEDVFFFAKIRAAGIPVVCDHSLSWEIGHVGEVIFTHKMAIDSRDEWEAAYKRGAQKYADKAEELEAKAQLEGAQG